MKVLPLAMVVLFAGSHAVEAADVKVSGDIRYRLERFDTEVLDNNGAKDNEDYIRTRVRARVKLSSQIHEKIKLTVRMASGSGEATSTNETLGGGFSNRAFNLDMAYFEYFAMEGLTIGAGKVANPVYRPLKSQLVFDSDVTPEGVYAAYKTEVAGFSIQPTLASFTLYENKANTDQELGIAQLVVGYELSGVQLKVGAAAYTYSNIQGLTASDPDGNSVITDVNTGDEVYEYEYELTDAFLEASMDVAGQPLGVYYHMVSNADPSDDNKGSAIGISYGAGKGDKPWQVALLQRRVEKDAVFSLIDDSDFNKGTTDGSGLQFNAKYAVVDGFTVGLTHFMYEAPLDPPAGTEALAESKTQIDFMYKF